MATSPTTCFSAFFFFFFADFGFADELRSICKHNTVNLNCATYSLGFSYKTWNGSISLWLTHSTTAILAFFSSSKVRRLKGMSPCLWCAAKATSAFLPVTFFSGEEPITIVCATTAIKPSTCAPRSL
ncbi:GSCOCG00006497001-RA-CDS, partial [Cotesia congregata]